MSDRIADIRLQAKGLLEQNSTSSERVQIRVDIGSLLPIYIGRSFPAGRFMAQIRSINPADLPPNYRTPELQGLAIGWVREKQKAAGPIDIVMELLQAEAVDIFVVFVARLCEVVERCENARDAIRQALSQIELWKHFFAGVASDALTENQQTGLYGELSVLRRLVDHGLDVGAGVSAWTGASATNQDFEFSSKAIEVKSTTSIDSSEIAVTNIRQLDTTGLELLYIARLAFDVRRGSTNSLVSLVDDLRGLVSAQASQLRTVFEEKLLNAGYRDEHASDYKERSYTIRSLEFYHVKENFPRLEERMIPSGIGKLKYSVNLSGCEKYIEDTESAITKVITASG